MLRASFGNLWVDASAFSNLKTRFASEDASRGSCKLAYLKGAGSESPDFLQMGIAVLTVSSHAQHSKEFLNKIPNLD